MAKKEKPAKEQPNAAEGDAPDGEAAAGGKKKLPLKLIIIAAVALLVIAGGGGTAAMILLKPKAGAEGQHADNGKDHAKKKEKKGEKHGEKKGEGEKLAGVVKEGPDGVVFYTMPDLSTNMQATDGRPHFLKLKVTFELPNEETVPTLEANMPRLQDMFLTFMRELRHEDVDGSQGNYTLRLEIQRRVNLVIAPSKVNAVLIEEMLEN